MQPNEANIVAQFLLPTVKREHEITRKVIAAVPAPKCTYTPDERSMTAIDLAWHLASSEWMFSRHGRGWSDAGRRRQTAGGNADARGRAQVL